MMNSLVMLYYVADLIEAHILYIAIACKCKLQIKENTKVKIALYD